MQETCQHTHKRYIGSMPCTGQQICYDCGKELVRERATEEEYKVSLERTIKVLKIKGYS